MPRNLTGAMVSALAQPSVMMCHLLELTLSESVYLTDAAVSLSWSGNVYQSAQLMSFSDVRESVDLALDRVTVGLSGVDQSVIALLLLYEYLNRPARIYKAVFDESWTVLADPNPLIVGRLDKPAIATDPESGTCTATIDIVSRFSPLGRRRGRYTNDADQQLHFPGDLAMQHVADAETTLVWGRRGHRNDPTLRVGLGGF